MEKAKELGLRTVCFAWPQGAVCKDVCDVFYPVSITEKEQILRICIDEKIDGICTIGSDISAPTVAFVAERMGLTANSYEAAVRANNKYLMREALTAAGVDCPSFRCMKVGSPLNLPAEGELALPLIVKPSDRSGSLGVRKITRREDLEPAVMQAEQLSLAGEAMVEEYIEGREISVEMISCRGTHYALQITDKQTTGAPHFVELAHYQPSDLPADMQDRIFAITRRALDALGLTEGASHSEYKITADGRIVVMEIGGRMGGDFIGSHLVRLSTGYDFVQGVIQVALGETIHPHPRALGRSSVRFMAPQNVSCSAERTGYIIYKNDEIYAKSVGGSADI